MGAQSRAQVVFGTSVDTQEKQPLYKILVQLMALIVNI